MDTIPNTPGIYVIRNLINGHIYVGSSVNLKRRHDRHFYKLNQGSHHNRHLQNAWNKYGANAFVFEVLEHVATEEDVVPREQHFIDLMKPHYNLSPTAGSPLGVRHTNATRAKMSALRKGKPSPKKGTFASEEAKLKMSIAHKGKPRPWNSRPMDEATKQKISNANKGHSATFSKKHTDESRRKTSESLKARYSDPEFRQRRAEISREVNARPELRQKKSEISKRVQSDPEYRAKMGETTKKRWEDPEYRVKMSQAIKAKYSDPEYQAKRVESHRKAWETRRARQAANLAQQPHLPMLDAPPVEPIDTAKLTQLSLWDDETS